MNEEVERLKRRLEREIKARKQAETTLEVKARDLFNANERLMQLNNELEHQIYARTFELEKSEIRYRQLVENASDIIYNISETGEFLYMNAIGIKAFGYAEEEIIGANFLTFVAPESKEQTAKHYAELASELWQNDYYEFSVLSKEGETYWIGQSVTLNTKENGELFFSAIARDISERKKAEAKLEDAQKALEKSEVKYRSIIENMDLGLMEVDLDGIITRVYEKFNEMTGYRGDELVGKIAKDVFTTPGYEDVVDENIEGRKKGETGVYEIKIRKKNGEHLWVIISGAPFYDEKGNVIGSIGIHYDITERKQMQLDLEKAKREAEEAQEAEQLFLASMSHEIRTPLNVMIGMSHLLEDTPLSGAQSDFLSVMKSASNMLKHLISDILDLSKIDAGKISPTTSSVDLVELCKSLITTFKVKSENHDVEWICELDSSLDHNYLTDAQMLNQVLINLLSNADRFTKKGQVSLKVFVAKKSEHTDLIRWEVLDTGIGIQQQDIAVIFDRYRQANNNISNEYGGTGLGLAISQKLLHLLGGEIVVESQLGIGSSFQFELELERRESTNSNAKNAFATPNEISGHGHKVLVVEDNKMNVKYVGALLEKWNFEFDHAANGKVALELFEPEKYALILMDLQMPEMDGFEATKELRNLPGGTDLPIIALTASTFISKKESALPLGMTDFLCKPFTPDQFSTLLSKYIEVEDQMTTKQAVLEYHISLDGEYLNDAYGGDLEHTVEMMSLFLDVLPDGMKRLEESVAKEDFKGIQQQSHRIKPTFTMVGLTPLSSLAREIGQAAKQNDFSDVERGFRELQRRIEESLPIIREEIIRIAKELKS